MALKSVWREAARHKKSGGSGGGDGHRTIWFERDVLLALRHPLLPAFRDVLATDAVVGFAIDRCGGGDLNSLRRRQTEKMFSDSVIRTVLFFAELALLQYGLVQSKPSMVAATAVYAARLPLKKTPLWTDTLKHHTGLTEAQLMDAAKILVASHSTAPDSKLKVVYKKYSSDKLGGVALPD
ncbi:G2/mitotic-specific cyclin-1-like [Triticum aestivum]|uniref:G2/mitotic-specific cyclin-1-like n=1 Tax=Triticum aestivum TaxID=4565 RepID=UPI001D0044FC|nr:G2/mitotic-specific cyclin-1-like [Triticum aestivum]